MFKIILDTILNMFSKRLKIINMIGKLPKHKIRTWNTRSLEDIKHIVVHQVGGSGNFEQIARYHVTPSENNHISKKGAPGICYHYGIDKNGIVYQFNEEKYRVWHVGRKNSWTIGILVLGNFDGPDYEGTEVPTAAQLKSLPKLLNSILERYSNADVRGHCEMGGYKKACPGNVLIKKLNKYRS